MDAAKKFVDYLLSSEAQQMIANEGTVPVRNDVDMPEKFGLPKPAEALQRAIKVKFTEIIGKK